jgi:hypothetical protein
MPWAGLLIMTSAGTFDALAMNVQSTGNRISSSFKRTSVQINKKIPYAAISEFTAQSVSHLADIELFFHWVHLRYVSYIFKKRNSLVDV